MDLLHFPVCVCGFISSLIGPVGYQEIKSCQAHVLETLKDNTKKWKSES